MQEKQVLSLGGEDPLEAGIVTSSSIPVWRIPWTGEPGGLQSTWVAKSLTRLKRLSKHPGIINKCCSFMVFKNIFCFLMKIFNFYNFFIDIVF